MFAYRVILPRLRISTRFLSLLLTGVILGLLSACSQEISENRLTLTATPGADRTPTPNSRTVGSLTPTGTPIPLPRSTLEVSPDELDGVKIEVWFFQPEEEFTPLLRAFNQDNPWGIQVLPRKFGNASDLEQALQTVSESDAGPVVLGYADQLRRWWEAGILTDLNHYVLDPDVGLSAAEQGDFLDIFWGQDVAETGRLGVPARREARFLVYNQTWATELGYSMPPTSPERLESQACAANAQKKADNEVQNDAFGGWLVDTRPETLLAWLHAFDANPSLPNERGYRFDTPQAEEAFSYLKNLLDANCAWVSIAPYQDEPFAQRQALLASASLVDLPFIAGAFEAASNPDEWTTLPFPSTAGGSLLPVYGPSFALRGDVSPENQLAGWLFIRWMVSPATQAFWTRLDGFFPVNQAGRDLLADYAAAHPQWSAAWDLLPYAFTEPPLASWGEVRWILQDAGTQVFRSYFTLERIPATLEELERTVMEITRENP
jgi:ABC-type glycerol-3-phosphate transport system substrate-binding protein